MSKIMYCLSVLFVISMTGIMMTGCPSGEPTPEPTPTPVPAAGGEMTDTIESVSLVIHYIPSHDYYVGYNPPESNNVTLTKGYWIAETEVTYELWYIVYQWATDDDNGDGIPDDDSSGNRDADGGALYDFANSGREGNNGTIGGFPTTSKNEPVTEVSWRDCMIWCNALSEKLGYIPVYYTDSGFITPIRSVTDNESQDNEEGHEDNPCVNWMSDGYRLPTEVEWEIAARGATSAVSGGTYGTACAGSDTIDDVAWYNDNSVNTTHPVGILDVNEVELCDMSGNVWEWCWDWYQGMSYPSAGVDPEGAETGSIRLYRGGSFISDEGNCVVSLRSGNYPYEEFVYTGFRPVRKE